MELLNTLVIIGNSGVGKTTFVKKILENMENSGLAKENVHIIDFKSQFPDEYKKYSDVTEMVNVAKTSKNSLFIFDDATGLLTRNASQIHNDLLFLLNTRRHDNNYYIFIFHTIKAFPVILECAVDVWIYFQTNNTPKIISDRCGSLTEDEAKKLGSKKNPYEYIAVFK